jgi:hypothetical protein
MKTNARGVSEIRSNLRALALGAAAATALAAVPAFAQAPAAPLAPAAPEATAAATAAPVAPAAAPAPPPPPYSLPWQLRPAAPGTVLRSDTSMALYEDPATKNAGSAVATMLLGSYKVTPNLAPLVRLGFVQNTTPDPVMGGVKAPEGTSFVNPIVGAIYGRKVGSFRLAGFGGVAIPIGQGGGDTPDAAAAGANNVGIRARSAMDNAMFAVNYFTAIAGVDAAYVDHKLTVQVEATVLQLFRTRGENAGAVSNDAARTNSTFGLHVGYFLLPVISLGGELRYQRWLSTPTTKNPMTMAVTNFPSANLDTLSVGVGPRFHFKLGPTTWLRPGISYSRVLDKPVSDASYNVIQLDVPVIF